MALETEYANLISIEEQLAAEVVPAFVAQSVCRPLVMIDQLTGGAKIAEFEKQGSLSASTPGESTAPTKQELTDSKVQVTAVKATVWTEESGESAIYLGSKGRDRLVFASSNALARHFDSTILALTSSVTAEAGTTGTALDEDAVIQAQYLLGAANAVGVATCVISPKGSKDLRTAFKDNGAVSLNSVAQRGLENGQINPAKWVGNVLGMDFYQSTSVYNDGTDDYALVFTPYGIGVAEANGGEIMYMEAQVPSKVTFERSLSYFYGAAIVTQSALVKLRHVD